MPRQKKAAERNAASASRTRKSRKDESSFESPAAPAATNHDPVEPRGTRKSVPGAGVVRAGADAGPASEDAGGYPGNPQKHGRLSSPGAKRPGTTRSGISATPSAGGAGRARSGRPSVTETASDGGTAPLSVPGQIDQAPRGSITGAPEVADPNFPITHGKRGRSGRQEKTTRR